MRLISSILLIGPTGAGKSPLGKEIEKRGLLGQRAHHFDFGENLRKVAKDELPFPEKEKNLIRTILSEGRLLRAEEFFLAEKILHTFLNLNNFNGRDLLLLNGLPRNHSQAESLSSKIQIKKVIYLHLDEKTLFLRLKNDPAGDRKGREDDLKELITKKLKWFKEKNLPLLEYYSQKGVKILEISVTERDTGFSLYKKLLNLWEKE